MKLRMKQISSMSHSKTRHPLQSHQGKTDKDLISAKRKTRNSGTEARKDMLRAEMR
jgi:hypothetical protein